MRVTVKHRFARVAPRKALFYGQPLKGRKVIDALAILGTRPTHTAVVLAKLLKSAMAAAKERAKITQVEEWRLDNLEVGQGPAFKRSIPRSHGRVAPIKKRTSHLILTIVSPSLEPKNSNLQVTTSKQRSISNKPDNKVRLTK